MKNAAKTGGRALRMHDWPLPEQPFPEYPRPQLVRDSYVNLNGLWDFAVTAPGKEPEFQTHILVPYPPESAASGIGRGHQKGETLWYRRRFRLPEGFRKARVLLHFGAVDQTACVLLNGKPVGEHAGGYLPFTLDVTEALREDENELTVRVLDDLDHRYPWGKQKEKRGGMWYTPVSGIWQTVWLESVPERWIRSLRFDPDPEGVTVRLEGGDGEITVHAPSGELSFSLTEGEVRRIPLPEPHFWTPEDPYLYRATVTLGEDRAETYFALRTLGIGTANGIPRLLLNGKPFFFHGLLDQGYYPHGLWLPEEAEDYRREIGRLKEMGFNTLRKHIKVEPELFYAACDELGMIVFQDMVNSGEYRFFRDTALPTVGVSRLPDNRPARGEETERREFFRQHCRDTVGALYDHPCICYWTLFNEGWGQFDSDRLVNELRKLDRSRIWDSTSGWFRQKASDVESLHIYFRPLKLGAAGDRPVVLSEFGGYALHLKDHSFSEGEYGYRRFRTVEDLRRAVTALYEKELLPLILKGLCAAIYTQVSDVEDEVNGVFTYDRRVEKLDTATMRPIAEALYRAFDESTAGK